MGALVDDDVIPFGARPVLLSYAKANAIVSNAPRIIPNINCTGHLPSRQVLNVAERNGFRQPGAVSGSAVVMDADRAIGRPRRNHRLAIGQYATFPRRGETPGMAWANQCP
jgi:hypothetical protein